MKPADDRAEYETVSIENLLTIDLGSPLPLYFQLETAIENKIQSKQWRPGQTLPSEKEFCETFDLSRTVIRQAFSGLERKGLLKKRNGKRTTIAYPSYSGTLLQTLRGFHEDAALRGQETVTKVLEFSVVPANDDVAFRLELSEGDSVIMLKRLRYFAGEPEVLVVTYIPLQSCPNIFQENFATQSLYEVLERKYNLCIAKANRTIKAIALNTVDAKFLDVMPRSPALLLSSVGILPDGKPIEYFIAKHRGDRSQFDVQLIRNSQ